MTSELFFYREGRESGTLPTPENTLLMQSNPVVLQYAVQRLNLKVLKIH